MFEVIEYNKKTGGQLYTGEREDDIMVIDISPLPEFRGKDICTKILGGMMAKASDKQKTLSLQVERNNPAYQLYLRLGFENTRNDGSYYCMEYRP